MRFIFLMVAIFVVGCAVTSGSRDLTFLQRETNKTYAAFWGGQNGFIKLVVNQKNYVGLPVRVDESNLFGFKSRYGNMKSIGALDGFLMNYYKVILTNEENVGIRCDIYTNYNGGSGICQDENSKVYDVLITKTSN